MKGIFRRSIKAIRKKIGWPNISKSELEMLYNMKPRHQGSPSCYFEFNSNDLRRRLYTFLKFFDIERINIIVKYDRNFLTELSTDIYGQWLIDERLFKLTKTPHEVKMRFSMDEKKDHVKISDDYFNHSESHFYVPITMHPGMYRFGYWNEKITESSRVNSIFFAGNFNPSTYRRLKEHGLFDLMNRTQLMESLRKLIPIKQVMTYEDLTNDNESNVATIVDTRNFEIPQKNLRTILSKYRFFLAAPGANVPHAHNLAEAMSAGTIPIIQKGYADLVFPPLKNKINAFIYEDHEELKIVIEKALSLSEEQSEAMTKEVYRYYEENMSPESVVRKIISENIRGVRLLSTSSSLKYLKKI